MNGLQLTVYRLQLTMPEQERKSLIESKSYAFAVEVVRVYQSIQKKKREFVLSKQLLRSGTSIGANIMEGLGAYTKKEFSSKLGIAYKETQETKYWLRLLRDTNYLTEADFEFLFKNCDELAKLLFTIIRSSRKSNNLANSSQFLNRNSKSASVR
jgi:four helix bundle protein